jgi:hypothetical protein
VRVAAQRRGRLLGGHEGAVCVLTEDYKEGAVVPVKRARGVGITPIETCRDVVLHIVSRAETLGYSTLYVAEVGTHDVSVLLTAIAL